MTWATRRVAEMATLVNGFPFDSGVFADSGDVPVVRIRDILAHDYATYVPASCVPASALVRNGDVVIGMDGDFNSTLWARGTAALNQRLCLLRANLRSDARFLAYAIPAELRKINELTYSTTVKHLSSQDVRRMRLFAPEQRGQVAIADFLDRETAKIDALVAKQQRFIGLLQLRRSTVSSRIVIGNDGHNGEAWYGTPPLHWAVDRLGRHVRVVNGSTPSRENPAYWSSEGFPWLNSSVVNQDKVVAADQFVTDTALAECHLPVLGPGVVLVGITGQGRTRGMAAELRMTATINQHVAALVPDRRRWHSRFLTLLLRAAYNELRFISDEAGSTKGALTCGDLASFRVPRPPLAEQVELAQRADVEVKRLDRLIAWCGQFIDLALERRSALITAAVTGQLDIGEAA